MRSTLIICVLMSSSIITSPISNESKHKRSLSFLTSLFFSDIGSTQTECARTSHRKSSRRNQTSTKANRRKEDIMDVSEGKRDAKKKKNTRSKPKRVRDKENTSLTNFSNDPYQAISQTIGTNTVPKPTTEKSTSQKPRIQNLSGNRLIPNHHQIMTTASENLNVDQIIYVTPKPYIIPPDIQFVNPMFGLQRKYSYEQTKGDIVQTFTLDNNSDVIVTETKKQVPRPAYVDDRIKDIILSVPPYGQEIEPNIENHQYDDRIQQIISSVTPYTNQFYPSIGSQQYEEAAINPNIAFDQQHENFGFKTLPSSHMYAGEPIIVMHDASEIIKKSLQEHEVNKIIEQNMTETARGDI